MCQGPEENLQNRTYIVVCQAAEKQVKLPRSYPKFRILLLLEEYRCGKGHKRNPGGCVLEVGVALW